MNEGRPLLTVVIPTRNRREMALEAARTALLPLPFPMEILLSDNGSSDGTPSLAAELPGVRYVRRDPVLPMAEHWTLCVQEARGRFVKVLCDDDWLLPGALEREVRALESDPALAGVASARTEVSPGGREKLVNPASGTLGGQALYWKMLVRENVLGPPTSVMFRRELFPGFPRNFVYAANFAAWVLLAERGAIRFLGEPGSRIRLHDSNLTHRLVDDDTDFLEVQALRRECARRLRGMRRLASWGVYPAIWCYRFARRLARYARLSRPGGIAHFLARVARYERPKLGA